MFIGSSNKKAPAPLPDGFLGRDRVDTAAGGCRKIGNSSSIIRDTCREIRHVPARLQNFCSTWYAIRIASCSLYVIMTILLVGFTMPEDHGGRKIEARVFFSRPPRRHVQHYTRPRNVILLTCGKRMRNKDRLPNSCPSCKRRKDMRAVDFKLRKEHRCTIIVAHSFVSSHFCDGMVSPVSIPASASRSANFATNASSSSARGSAAIAAKFCAQHNQRHCYPPFLFRCSYEFLH